MKISVDVDCTPAEARHFLGLPDLTPIHDVYVERMTRLMTEATATEALGEMMRNWGPMNDAGLAVWRQMIDSMGGKRG